MRSSSLALTALAAVSLAGCSSGDDRVTSPTDESNLTAAWPTPKLGTSCVTLQPVSAARVSNGYVRFVFTKPVDTLLARIEAYDASSGELVDTTPLFARVDGRTLTISASSSFEWGEAARVTRANQLNGEVDTKLVPTNGGALEERIGAGPVSVACDVDPGRPRAVNPARARQRVGTMEVTSKSSPWPTPHRTTCVGAGAIPAGANAGKRLRVFFDHFMTDGLVVRARVEVYDPATGFVTWDERFVVEPDGDGGYELFGPQTTFFKRALARIRPTTFAGKTVMALEARGGLGDDVGGTVPLDCDFP